MARKYLVTIKHAEPVQGRTCFVIPENSSFEAICFALRKFRLLGQGEVRVIKCELLGG